MTEASREAVEAALKGIRDPQSGKDVLEAGVISGLVVEDGRAAFAVEVSPDIGPRAEPLRAACEAAVRKVRGIRTVTAVLTAHSRPGPSRPGAARPEAQHPAQRSAASLPGIGAAIAVASGKGGVGKSTLAVNLALALSTLGNRVGLLDADIYGPSVPRLLGLKGKPQTEGKRLKPMQAFGLKAMSIGLLVGEDTPMIWRGPMVMSALSQLIAEVDWAPLDILVLDMPPGTGDAQLTIAQRAPLAGAVIVSTPQDIALIDARKGIAMFQRTEVPILGLVENMSVFVCPHCGKESHIFGRGGARATAQDIGVPFLGEVPLVPVIRETSDTGTPVVATRPNSAEAKAFVAIAEAVVERLAATRKAAPAIIVE